FDGSSIALAMGSVVLPPVRDLRETSFAVAVAVARAAAEDDVAWAGTDDIEAAVRAVTWELE
ncbi:hypothetical protein, partial [Klebsiella aerogenes]|uniref:hypothetical protein n=1 Tax=Klebsiella aerogenes TaxID=548 RepID=UPI0013D0AF25